MSIRHAILGLLHAGPLHGYELKSLYEKQLVPSGKLNFGQVYTTLDRLHRDGLVGHDRVSQAERPDKKVFNLTDAGRLQLESWLQTPTRTELDVRNETYLKIMVARRLQGMDPLVVLRVEKRSCFARLHEVTRARADATRAGAGLESILLLDLAVLKLEAFMKWLERSEETLRKEA